MVIPYISNFYGYCVVAFLRIFKIISLFHLVELCVSNVKNFHFLHFSRHQIKHICQNESTCNISYKSKSNLLQNYYYHLLVYWDQSKMKQPVVNVEL